LQDDSDSKRKTEASKKKELLVLILK